MTDFDTQEAKKQVANMSFKEKLVHYLGYYKIHILVGVCLIAGVISFIHTQVTRDVYLMYFGVLNSPQINRELLQDEMKETLEAKGRENVQVYTDLSSSASSSATGEMYSMLAIYVAADELDVAFADEEGANFAALSDGLMLVEDWASPELLTLYKDRIIELDVDEDAGGMKEDATIVSKPVVIDIAGTKLMERLGLSEETHYLMVLAGSDRTEEIQKFCDYVVHIEQ